MNRTATLAALLPLALAAAPAPAQTDVSSTNKFCWGENVGFMNCRDANNGAQGAQLHATFLSGFIWGENIGWINLGDGTPAGGGSYGNTDGADFGVNLDPATGNLTGLAWGENVGWINFSGGALATPAQPARISLTGQRRLHGYAWGENIGWINLDHGQIFVEFLGCRADWNQDGQVNSTDISAFLTTWLGSINNGDLLADFNNDAAVNSTDISAFLTAWLQAINGNCP
jgi:hypothetical protein